MSLAGQRERIVLPSKTLGEQSAVIEFHQDDQFVAASLRRQCSVYTIKMPSERGRPQVVIVCLKRLLRIPYRTVEDRTAVGGDDDLRQV